MTLVFIVFGIIEINYFSINNIISILQTQKCQKSPLINQWGSPQLHTHYVFNIFILFKGVLETKYKNSYYRDAPAFIFFGIIEIND